MANILITGGTGMVGRALTKKLTADGHQVVVLSRNPAKGKPQQGVRYAAWNVGAGTIDQQAVADADVLVHLAGANVAQGRWTAARKKEIVDSRVQSGALLVKALREMPNKIHTVVSASAIGWYGADPQIPNPKPFAETAPADDEFLGKICVQWESAIEPVEELGKRLVILRIGIVLSNEGGAFAAFKKPAQFGIQAALGTGKQMISWIHIDDLVGLFQKAIADKNMTGVYNAVAPQPVSNERMMEEIGKHGHKLASVKVPQFLLKLALGEMSIEILKSATVRSAKAEAAGYVFQFPSVQTAVANLMR